MHLIPSLIPSHRGISIDALVRSGLYPSLEPFYLMWKQKHNLPIGTLEQDISRYKKTLFWWYMTVLGMAIASFLSYRQFGSMVVPIILLILTVSFLMSILKKDRQPFAAFIHDFQMLESCFPNEEIDRFKNVMMLRDLHPTIEEGLRVLARSTVREHSAQEPFDEEPACLNSPLQRLAETAKHRFGIMTKPPVHYIRECTYEETAP